MAEIVNELIPITAITDHPRNYRAHPGEQVAKLRASIARFGQVRSVVVQRGGPGKFLMVAGHGIKKAALEEGIFELRADIIPADWTDEQVTGYLVADNQGGADDDKRELAAILREQREMGFDLSSLGSSDHDLDNLLRSLKSDDGDEDIDFEALVSPMGGGEASELQWEIAVIAETPDQRDTLVTQLRDLGFEPEVSSVRVVD